MGSIKLLEYPDDVFERLVHRLMELEAENAQLRESLANQNSKEERLLAAAERIAEMKKL